MSPPGECERRRWRLGLRDWLLGRGLPQPRDPGAERALLEAAGREGLAGLLAGAPETAAWPRELRARLLATRQALLFRGVQQLDALARASQLLARAGLRSLPLKGAALAEELYASVAERPMCDVDLLALEDFPAALRLLEASGLRLVDRSDHAAALASSDGLVLELHEAVTSCPGLFAARPESLWARSRAGVGQVPRLPAPEDLLVQLALHAAFQHGLALTLVQYLDFRRLLERPLDAGLAAAIARETGAEAALAVSLEAASMLVGARVPEALRAVLASALTRRDRAWLGAWLAQPARVLAPGSPPLARLRWMIAAGRRGTLLRGTLRGGGGRRALALASRWAAPSLRQLLPARRPTA